MSTTNKTHTAFIRSDGVEYDPQKFIYLEGPCKKCLASNNSLIVLTYKPNDADRGEGIFETVCITCSAIHIYYYKNIDIRIE